MLVYLLVTGSPEKTQYPAEVRAPVAVAKSRITVSEPRPEFGKQILQERRPFMYTLADDDDDWFVLLDLAPKVSGICYSPVCDRFLCSTLLQLDERTCQSLFLPECVCRRHCTFILSPRPHNFSLRLDASF